MTTFNYNSKSSIKESLKTTLISVALIVVPLVYPFGIRIKRLHLLGPVPTTIILVSIGVALLIYIIISIRKARLLTARNGIIAVDEGRVTYPIVEKGMIETRSFQISEISSLDYNEGDGILTITLTNGAGVEFKLAFFDSLYKFKEFVELIQS